MITFQKAVAYLIDREKVIAEPAGAAFVAAVMENKELYRRKNVAAIVSGGNLDEKLMRKILSVYS